MKSEYRIKIEGKLTKVNSKEEYEEFKAKYNNYEFMMTNRINEVEAVKKSVKDGQKPKKTSKLDLILNRLDGLENKIDTIVKLNNLRTVS
jgi:hypothetical protein